MIDEKKYKIRLDSFNLIKGLLIIGIILAHKYLTYNVGFVNQFFKSPWGTALLSCGMPAFFIIAGVTFRETTVKKCLKKTFGELIKPYLCVMVVFAALFPVMHYLMFKWWPGALAESTRYFLAFLLGVPMSGKVFLGYELYSNTPVWFFLALFVGLNLLNLILKIKNDKVRFAVVVLCTVCGYFLGVYKIDYFCISQGLIALGYCYLGFLIKKYKLYANTRVHWGSLLLLIPVVFQAIYGEFDMSKSIYKLGYAECILVGCSGLLVVSLGFLCGRKEWKVLDPIKNVGVYTYWILCIHSVESWCIPWYKWSEFMGREKALLAFGLDLLVTAVLLTVCCFVLKMITKLKYKLSRINLKEIFLAGLNRIKQDDEKYKIRLDTFNLLKGFLILCVVVMHKAEFYSAGPSGVLLTSIPGRIINGGAMAAFFMVAGMTFRATTVKKYLAKTFRELIKPYLWVMVVFAAVFPLIHYATFGWWEGALQESTRYFLGFLLGTPTSGYKFLGYELYSCSAAWFFLSMFGALNFLNLVTKIKNKYVRHLVVLVCTFCGYLLAESKLEYFCISRGLISLGYCYIGLLVKETKFYAKKYMPVVCLVLLGVAAYYANVTYDLGYFRLVLKASIGLMLVLLGIICGRVQWKVLDPIKTLGVYSFWILCAHSVELRSVPWYKWSEIMANNLLLAFLLDLVAAGVLIFVCCVVIKQITKLKYKYNREGKPCGLIIAGLDCIKLDEKKYKIRLDMFNLLKGFLILLVILGHKIDFYQHPVLNEIFDSDAMKILKNSAMPAFFMVAGMSFRVTTVKKSLNKTFHDLIVPYLYVMAAFAVLFPVIHYLTFDYWEGALQESTRYFLGFLLGLPDSGKKFLGYELYNCSAAWFMISMFIVFNILNLVLKIKNTMLRHGVVAVLFVCGFILEEHGISYYCISRALRDTAYCYVGWLLKNYKVYCNRYMPILFVILAAFTVYSVDPGEGTSDLVISLLSGCSGMLLVILGIICGRIEWKILDPLKSIGVYSYWILCIHAVELRCVPWYKWSEYMAEKQVLAYFADMAAAGILMLICCTAFKRISKWNYKRKLKAKTRA